MIAIQRRDNNMWAMPGGMVECNESASAAAKREFTEEALKDASGMYSILRNRPHEYELFIFPLTHADSEWLKVWPW